MKRYGIKLLSVVLLSACVPAAKPEVQSQPIDVTFVGSFSGSAGTTKIYFGKEETPFVTTTTQGVFHIQILRALIEKSSDRRLYFYNSNGQQAVSEEILAFDNGEKKIKDVELASPLLMTGTVLATVNGKEAPIADAEIVVGREKATTDKAGNYQIDAPRNTEVPVLLHKKGFVQTRALWTTEESEESRNFHLFTRLEPMGSLSIPSTVRFAATTVPLYLESTPNAAFVRIGTAAFTVSAEADSTWLDLSKNISLSSSTVSEINLYYQFADKDKKIVGPVQVFSPNNNSLGEQQNDSKD